MNSWINLHALWRIVVVGVIAGAGLPAMFALGLRALTPAGASGEPTAGGAVPARNPLGVALAVVCFAVVLGGVAWGVYLIVDGK